MKKLIVLVSSILLLQMNVSLGQSTAHSTVESFDECFNSKVVPNLDGFVFHSFIEKNESLGYVVSNSLSKKLKKIKNIKILNIEVTGKNAFNKSASLISESDEGAQYFTTKCRNSDDEYILPIDIDSHPALKSFLIGKGKNKYIVAFIAL